MPGLPLLLMVVIMSGHPLHFKVVDTFPSEADMDQHLFSLDQPVDMGLCGDKVLVLDQKEHCVHMFSHGGDYLGDVGRLGNGPGEFTYPSMLFATADGFWVYDQRRHLQRFDG